MAWSFIAQRATTGEFLDWDVPLNLGGLEWQLSGPGSLKATVAPDVGGLRASDGQLLLEEWGTLLYAEHDGQIRWGGIVITSSFQGETWSIEAAGFTTYPHSRTYRGDYSHVQIDPAEVIRHLWQHVQSFPDADLGVSVVGDSTPIRLGTLAYATDENGVVLDYAIPHKQWGDLFAKGWVGGPVRKVDVEDDLWAWLINHGFTYSPDSTAVALPPLSWTDEFQWWESEILNLGWVGGPVRAQDVRPELYAYLSSHGWQSRTWDPIVQVYPPTLHNDNAAYPDEVWPALFNLGWVGGDVRHRDVPDWVWAKLLQYGWTGDDTLIHQPATLGSDTGMPGWETDLLNLHWVGGPVRKADVSADLWNTLLQGHWRARPARAEDGSIINDPVAYYGADVVYPPIYIAPALDDGDTVTEAAPFELHWYEAPNCGDEIDSLVKATPLDFVERHTWTEDHEEIIHEVVLGYPRIGQRRDDLVFTQDDNVISVVTIESNGDDYANSVVGLGAGEGAAMLRRETSIRDGRLVRDYVYTDKAVTDDARMDAAITTELNARRAALRVEALDVIDHPNAPIGSWQLGDDVLVRAELPWLGEIEVWCRITGWSLTGENTASLTLVRSDLYSYGG